MTHPSHTLSFAQRASLNAMVLVPLIALMVINSVAISNAERDVSSRRAALGAEAGTACGSHTETLPDVQRCLAYCSLHDDVWGDACTASLISEVSAS